MYIYQSLSIILSIILFSSLQQVTLLKMVGLHGQIGLLALLHVVMESSKEVDHVTALITAVKGPLFRPDPALYKNVINDVSITICCMQQLKDETFTLVSQLQQGVRGNLSKVRVFPDVFTVTRTS